MQLLHSGEKYNVTFAEIDQQPPGMEEFRTQNVHDLSLAGHQLVGDEGANLPDVINTSVIVFKDDQIEVTVDALRGDGTPWKDVAFAIYALNEFPTPENSDGDQANHDRALLKTADVNSKGQAHFSVKLPEAAVHGQACEFDFVGLADAKNADQFLPEHMVPNVDGVRIRVTGNPTQGGYLDAGKTVCKDKSEVTTTSAETTTSQATTSSSTPESSTSSSEVTESTPPTTTPEQSTTTITIPKTGAEAGHTTEIGGTAVFLGLVALFAAGVRARRRSGRARR